MVHFSYTPVSEYRDKKFYLSNDNSKMIEEVIEVLRYYSKKFNSYKNIKCLAIYTSKIPERSFYYSKNAKKLYIKSKKYIYLFIYKILLIFDFL